MGCRFSLLGLSYRLLNSPLLQPDRKLAVQLRSRISDNALDWFAHNRGWNGPRSMLEFEEDLNWLVELSSFLKAEIRVLTGPTAAESAATQMSYLGSEDRFCDRLVALFLAFLLSGLASCPLVPPPPLLSHL